MLVGLIEDHRDGRDEADGCLAQITYCDIEGGVEGILIVEDGELEVADEIIDEDPLFTDPENGDYHLTVDSPCIDAGDPELPLDPDGTRADIGAFYLHQKDIIFPDFPSDRIVFESIQTGEMDSISLPIGNIGLTPLHIYPARITGNEKVFHAWNDTLVIEPESERRIWLYYTPLEVIRYRASLFVYSDDPDEGRFSLVLAGDPLSIEDMNLLNPVEFAFISITPNPFNSSTTIAYTLPHRTPVTLSLYDISGREVLRLDECVREAGSYSQMINGIELASGIYIVGLQSDMGTITNKIILVK